MIKLKIMTPDSGICFENEVKYVDVKTQTGHIGLQHGITPMIAALDNGACTIKRDNQPDLVGIVCKGTLYVDKQEGIKIFTSGFAWLDKISQAEVENEIKTLEEKISKLDPNHKDYTDYVDQLIINKNLLAGLKNK